MHRPHEGNGVAPDPSPTGSWMRNDPPINENLRLGRHWSILVRYRQMVKTLLKLRNLSLNHLGRAHSSVSIKAKPLGITHKQRKRPFRARSNVMIERLQYIAHNLNLVTHLGDFSSHRPHISAGQAPN
jgi:hypothetical protein